MIIWISGVATVGKSTVTKSIVSKLKDHYREISAEGDHGYKSNSGYKIPFQTYGNTMILGREPRDGQVLNGTDAVYIGVNKFQSFIEYEYFKWKTIFTPNIIIEGHKYISKNTMHDFMINNNIKYKMYYLKVPMEIMDERSKKRDKGFDRNQRTTNMIEKQLIEYDKVISKYKSNVEIRSSESWESCENLANEIFESLELII